MSDFDDDAPPCPSCASPDVIPIIRGEPTPEAEEAAARGEAIIGGCCVFPGLPLWQCRACEHQFGEFGVDDGGIDG